MKKTIEKTDLKNDFFNFACWKTASLIKSKFNSNPTSFYDTFTKWSNLKTLNGDEYGKTWQNIRLVNEFLSIDIVLVRTITKNTSSVVDDLVQEKKIKKFNNGTLRWTNKAGEKKEQRFKCRYVPDKSEFEKHPLSWWLSFKQNDFSPRLKKFIGKYFEKTNPEQQQLVEYICEQLEKEESIDMTKAEKEQYQKEYEEGKHMLDLEQYEKHLAKKAKRADKHRMTIAKKASRQTLTDYAKLETERKFLETERNLLKADNDELKEKVYALEEKVQKLTDEIQLIKKEVQPVIDALKARKAQPQPQTQTQTPKPEPLIQVQQPQTTQPQPQTQTQTQTPQPKPLIQQPQPQPQIQTPEDDIPDHDGIVAKLKDLVNQRVIVVDEANKLAELQGVSSSAWAKNDYKSLDYIHLSKEQWQSRFDIFDEVYTKFITGIDKDTLKNLDKATRDILHDFRTQKRDAESHLTPVDGMGDTQAARVRGEKDYQFHRDEPVRLVQQDTNPQIQLTDEAMEELVREAF